MTDPPTDTSEPRDHVSARALFERSYGLLNEHDSRRIPEVFTEDVVFEDDAWPETVRGHDDMERFPRRSVDCDARLPLLAARGSISERGWSSSRGSSTRRRNRHRPLRPPGFGPTGTRVNVEYGGFYEIEGERIKRARIILNMNDVGIQIGAAPALGSLGAHLAVRMQRLNARRMRRRASA